MFSWYIDMPVFDNAWSDEMIAAEWFRRVLKNEMVADRNRSAVVKALTNIPLIERIKTLFK